MHLVNHVHGKRDEFTLVPYVITDDELEQVWASPALVAEVSGKLKLTLDLDLDLDTGSSHGCSAWPRTRTRSWR